MTLPVTSDLALFVLSVLAKGGILLGGVAVAAWLLRDCAAAYRHAVWAMGLGALLCLPVAEGGLPQWARVEVASSIAAPSGTPQPSSTTTANETADETADEAAAPASIGAASGPTAPQEFTADESVTHEHGSREHARSEYQDARAASQALAGRTDPVGAEDGTEPTAAWVGGIGAADVLRGLLLV